MLYRKMWLAALLYFSLSYVTAKFLGLTSETGHADPNSSASSTLLAVLFWLVVQIVPAVFADGWYYNHCQRKITKAKQNSSDIQHQLAELSSKGGTSLIVLYLLLIPIVGIIAAVALPAYQDYTIRAKVVAAVTEGQAASRLVETYYRHNQRVPQSLEAAGYTATPQAYWDQVSVNPANGVVTVKMAATLPNLVAGKSVQLVPQLATDGSISWSCHSDGIAKRWLPLNCRE